MDLNDDVLHYRHDTIGKFNLIKSLVESAEKSGIKNPSSFEVLNAVHELILKMAQSSKSFILQNFSQQATLVIGEKNSLSNLSLLKIGDLVIRSKVTTDSATYYYFLSENNGNIKEDLKILLTLLPINSIQTSPLLDEFSYEQLVNL